MSAYIGMLSLVTRWFTRNRALMNGIVLSGMSAGTMLGAPLIAYFIARYDWRTALVIMAVISLVVMAGAVAFLVKVLWVHRI